VVSNPFKCVLDCQDLEFIQVQEVICTEKSVEQICSNFEPRTSLEEMNNWFELERVDLFYKVDKWSIQIWKENIRFVEHFPKAIYLQYRTKPSGLSLLWRKNQVNFQGEIMDTNFSTKLYTEGCVMYFTSTVYIVSSDWHNPN
jgi:hypothetical protein